MSNTPLMNDDGEIRELTDDEFAKMKPLSEVNPALFKKITKGRGPQKKATKESITIRLSPDVLHAFKATGTGWQGRVDNALKEWLADHHRLL